MFEELVTKGGRTTALLATMPAYLKDRANFEKIYTAIANAGHTKHSHGEVSEWAACSHCQSKANDRLLMMRSLGFTSKAMYLSWIKIHQKLEELAPLEGRIDRKKK